MGINAPVRKATCPVRNGSSSGKEWTPAERRVQVAAARLRVTLDERLGRETPAKGKALAKESF